MIARLRATVVIMARIIEMYPQSQIGGTASPQNINIIRAIAAQSKNGADASSKMVAGVGSPPYDSTSKSFQNGTYYHDYWQEGRDDGDNWYFLSQLYPDWAESYKDGIEDKVNKKYGDPLYKQGVIYAVGYIP